MRFVVTPQIKMWAEQMVRVMKQGGVWGLPSSPNLTYMFDSANKRLILLPPPAAPDEEEVNVHNMNVLTFNSVGWTVVPSFLKRDGHDG